MGPLVPSTYGGSSYKQVFNPANYNSRVAFAMAETLAGLRVKRVIAFCENTDYGIGQAKAVAEALKKKAPDVEYRYETLDRTGKDFTPAVYIVMNQLYEQGVAPSDKTFKSARRSGPSAAPSAAPSGRPR